MKSEKTRRRLAAEIQRLLAEILEFEVKDPALRAAAPTVMEVILTPDAQRATVYVYVEGEPETRQAALMALDHDEGYLRTQLAHRLHVRRVPELSFQLDDTLDRALRLEELFDEDSE